MKTDLPVIGPGHNSDGQDLIETRKFVAELIEKGRADSKRPRFARSLAELDAFVAASEAGRPMNLPTLARLTRT